jgi:hypothetical protein
MKYRLFIVEDNPESGARYLKALRDSEYFEPELFPGMEEADAAAEARSPHLLLADVRPGQAGAKAKDATGHLEKIRAGSTNFDPRIPVVLFTVDFRKLDDETVKRAVALNVSKLFTKDKDITPKNAAKVLKRVLDEIHENDDVIRALRLVRAQSDKQTLLVVPAKGGKEEGLTIDEVIRHMEMNDEFAQNFRAGLNAVAITLIQGAKRTKK